MRTNILKAIGDSVPHFILNYTDQSIEAFQQFLYEAGARDAGDAKSVSMVTLRQIAKHLALHPQLLGASFAYMAELIGSVEPIDQRGLDQSIFVSALLKSPAIQQYIPLLQKLCHYFPIGMRGELLLGSVTKEQLFGPACNWWGVICVFKKLMGGATGHQKKQLFALFAPLAFWNVKQSY